GLLELMRKPRTEKRKRKGQGPTSLDGDLDGLRLRGRLLLRDPDLEDAVFQRRRGEVGLDLLREAQHALEGLVRPLAVLVVLLLLCLNLLALSLHGASPQRGLFRGQ